MYLQVQKMQYKTTNFNLFLISVIPCAPVYNLLSNVIDLIDWNVLS
jgi:hypothetical protein